MSREEMNSALKAHLVPALRQLGFKGSLPHFRRQRENRVDLLTIQFDRQGGGFVVEISWCGVEGITTHWGKLIPALKVTAHDIPPRQRHRLGTSEQSPDHWFRFDQGLSPTLVAHSVSAYLDAGERWWASR
ncbi:DUF4304 domain-containing protein [Paraburkholderia sediminicola]|nr:DUF4304 domain-containing protein [Paraburkholderia sediminicola]